MSDIRAIIVPKWGLSMEEGTVTKWLIDEGQPFNEGDEIVEIETDKIANVVEAPFTGRLRKIIAEAGATLPVGALIAVSADETVDVGDIAAFVEEQARPAGGTPNGAAAKIKADNSVQQDNMGMQATPPQERVAGATGLPAALQGDEDDSGVFATLHARKLAHALGVNLTKVKGSGRRGRISKADIEAVIIANDGVADMVSLVGNRSLSASESTPSGGVGVASPATIQVSTTQGARTIKPLSNMRKTIAKRLVGSKLSAPHYRVTMDCSIDELLKMRKRLNESNPDAKLSVNDFVIKACAMALIAEPECNVQFDGENIYSFSHADITVAVALPTGLITPKIERADTKGLAEISREMKELAERAKSGGLSPEEYQGGTFSISNLGMFGVRQFDAIINPPQCVILAVGQGAPRYAPGADRPILVNEMTLCLSSDHRIIDGALAAKLLGRIKQNLESPLLMLA